MADYPGSIFEPREVENLPGIVYDAAKPTEIYAEDFSLPAAEIVAIQETLGVNPQGAYATVKAWLEALAASPAAVWGSITGTLSDQTDLQTALNAKEDVANKATTMSGNTTSNTKYLSAKAVYDWAVATFQAALGFTPEDVANKSTTMSGNTTSNTKYLSAKAVYDWATSTFSTVTTFLGLSDTPSSYSGQGGKHVAVKSDASGLEFVTAPYSGPAFPNSTAFNSTAPNTYTDLDLSSIVGAQSRVVYIKLFQSTSASVRYYFRPNGVTDAEPSSSGAGGAAYSNANITQNSAVYLVLVTDSAGIVEWKAASSGISCTITVLAYW